MSPRPPRSVPPLAPEVRAALRAHPAIRVALARLPPAQRAAASQTIADTIAAAVATRLGRGGRRG